jgi:hypothetical protein
MSGESWAGLLTGIVAGFVALIGFLLNQLANRRERKSQVYAEALRAIKAYQELPYRIRRRASSDGPTREALGSRISDVYTDLAFYLAWLEIDSREVGFAYSDLVHQTRASSSGHWSNAWEEPVMTSDEEVYLKGMQYKYDNDPEHTLCLLAMRRELSPWTIFSRISTRRRLDAQRRMRMDERVRPAAGVAVPAEGGRAGRAGP